MHCVRLASAGAMWLVAAMTAHAKKSAIRDRFWETVSLEDMTAAEWEALCDGCGKCCMSKLIDEDTDEVLYTTVACRLFDAQACRCADYANRFKEVPDCVQLTPENVGTIPWLPKTCAYRLLAGGWPLYEWHPLISGDPQSVHKAHVSMRGKVTAFEQELAHEGEYLDHLVEDGM